jgi:hypothetical protein
MLWYGTVLTLCVTGSAVIPPRTPAGPAILLHP